MPSFFCVAGSAVQSRPASPVGLPSGEGFSFESFVFRVLRFLRFRFSVTVMSLAFYTDIESSRVEQQQQQQFIEEVVIVVPLFSFFRHFLYVLFPVLHTPFSTWGFF